MLISAKHISLLLMCCWPGSRMFGGVSGRIQRDRQRAGGLGSVQQAVRHQNQDFQALQEDCLQNGSLFEDPMFPAEPASLGFKELGPFTAKTKGVEWKRPTVRTTVVMGTEHRPNSPNVSGPGNRK